jgi:predicted GTPase
VRTGVGKSQTTRKVIEALMAMGLRPVAIRHPMPYGDLRRQRVQRFAVLSDLSDHDCTIEEMEEYEPHVVRGNVIYAGIDYEAIVRAAEDDPSGCDVIVWDGGNNDFSFLRSDLYLTLIDPHRPGHELSYYAGETNLRLADVVIINKLDSATPEGEAAVTANIAAVNPTATVVRANSSIRVDDPDVIRGRRVLVVEDGPTLTHGGMTIGAGTVAAQMHGAAAIVDPRPWVTGRLAETFRTYPDIGALLPAMGYGEEQIRDLEATIAAVDCDAVVIGTPIDLSRILRIDAPHTRVHYDLDEIGEPDLRGILGSFVGERGLV